MTDDLDTCDLLTWEDGLPRPQWIRIETWANSHADPAAQRDSWVKACRKWLNELGRALQGPYECVESENFLALAPKTADAGDRILWIAEQCRDALLEMFEEVADFKVAGKQTLLIFRTSEDYYRYISFYFPEGEHGGSLGVHMRKDYPHIAINCLNWSVESTLAHELTHACFHHLTMPRWLEEGLARVVQHRIATRPLLAANTMLARRQKHYWGKHGLDGFWSGRAFSKPPRVQHLSYQLAEIIVRHLLQEFEPRWFGWVQKPRQHLIAFLRTAKRQDHGMAACRECLGFDLGDLAAKFLGPGLWSPNLKCGEGKQ
jgi:hypothetical protein